jgi:hypothetical protein
LAEDYYVLAAPVLSGKLEKWKSMMKEVKGPRRKAYQASRKKMGIKHERVFLQHSPMGDFALVSFEGKDTSRVIEKFMKSKDPFDMWFAKNLQEIHGIEVSTSPMEINEIYLDLL